MERGLKPIKGKGGARARDLVSILAIEKTASKTSKCRRQAVYVELPVWVE
jgi:hypothetical protein